MQRLKFINEKQIFIFLVPILIWAVGMTVINSSSIPYNVRELFLTESPAVSLLLLIVLPYWSFGLPVVMYPPLINGGRLRLIAYPFAVALHGAFAFLLLRFAVPDESLHDIVGYPVLGWPWEWEMLLRFIALYSILSIILGLVAIIVLRKSLVSLGIVKLLVWSSLSFFFLCLSHWGVVIQAGTDNLTELMSGGGSWLSSICIFTGIFSLVFVGSLFAANMAKLKLKSFTSSASLLVLSLSLSYIMFFLGSEDSINKYGKQFSAMQFLLSPDRANYLTGIDLFVRYFGTSFFFVLLVSWTQYSSLSFKHKISTITD